MAFAIFPLNVCRNPCQVVFFLEGGFVANFLKRNFCLFMQMLLTVDGMTNFKIHSARGNRDSFCLCGGQSSTKKFYITAQNIGKLPIFAGVCRIVTLFIFMLL